MNLDDPYIYPGSTVLKNKFGIKDSAHFDAIERRLVAQRAAEGVPLGRFDLLHLRAIHRHLFQDIFDWAGAVRVVEIAKDGHQFQFRQYIETGMAKNRKCAKPWTRISGNGESRRPTDPLCASRSAQPA